MWPHALGVNVDPRSRGLVGMSGTSTVNSKYGEYPWDVGELAKVEGDTDYVDLFKIM